MRVLQFCNLVSLIKVNIITEISFIPEINSLAPEDAVLDYGQLGNFSLAGFEMVLTRYVSTYIITYYLPSGTEMIISELINTNYCILYCIRSVCDCILDILSHPYGRDTGQDGPAGHLVPGAGQHLQQRHHQHSQGGGSHCHRSLDVSLHSFCVRCSSRVRNIIYANRQLPSA